MARWVSVARADAIERGKMVGVNVEGQPVTLYHLESGFHATSGVCTHLPVLLHCGLLRGDTIICGAHGASFDVKTGKCLGRPAIADLKHYPTRVADGEIQISLPEP